MCPFPDQTVLDAYIKSYKEIITAAQADNALHTDDRYNLRAIFTQLVQNKGIAKNETWAEVVESNFNINYWPQVQSNQTRTCVDIVVYDSPANLFKLGSVKLSAYGTLLLAATAAYASY